MSDRALVQAAFTAILQHFVEFGRAPHYVDLADILGLDIEECRELQRETAAIANDLGSSTWLTHDSDYVEVWAPFSNLPTNVLISVDGVQKWYGL